jgi:Holliday junction resolvase RusA-like endonuclease
LQSFEVLKEVKMQIKFFVPGTPAPGGSKRGFYIKNIGRVVMAPASNKTKPWMAIVSAFAKEAYQGELLQGALKLTFEFRLLRPKTHYGTGKKANILKSSAPIYSTVKPDLTKLERSTEDALVGIIMRDDSQVAEKATKKIYVERDSGVEIVIETINGQNQEANASQQS